MAEEAPPAERPTEAAPVPVRIRILDMRKHPSLEVSRRGKEDVTFSYMYGAEGPFTVTVPYEEIGGKPVAEQNRVVKGYIMKAQEERLSWKGREIG